MPCPVKCLSVQAIYFDKAGTKTADDFRIKIIIYNNFTVP